MENGPISKVHPKAGEKSGTRIKYVEAEVKKSYSIRNRHHQLAPSYEI